MVNDVKVHPPSRFNGVPDEDELFLELRSQVQREPQDRSSIRVVQASLQPPPLNVTAVRDRNIGLRTFQLVERIHGQQEDSIAQPSLSLSHERKSSRFTSGRAPCRVPTVMRPGPAAARSALTPWRERTHTGLDTFSSVVRPDPAILAASRDPDVGATGVTTQQVPQGSAPKSLTGRLTVQSPATSVHASSGPKMSPQAQEQGSTTNGDKSLPCQRKRPVGPRPLINSLSAATVETNAMNQEGEDTHAVPTWNTTQRCSNVEQPATTRKSHDSMGTRIRNIQQLYQDWPSYLPPSGSKADTNDVANNQQRGHVVLIQEPDLVYLLSQGILALKPDPQSKVPAWLLDIGPTGCHEDEDLDTGSDRDRLCRNSEKRSVRVVERSSSTPSLRSSRVRSQMAQIEIVNSSDEENLDATNEQQKLQRRPHRRQQVRRWPFAESIPRLANSKVVQSSPLEPKKDYCVISMSSGRQSPPVDGAASRLSWEGSTEDDAWMLVTPSYGCLSSVGSSLSEAQATTRSGSGLSISSVTP